MVKAVDGVGGGTYLGALIFSDITVSGTNKYNLASRVLTRAHDGVAIAWHATVWQLNISNDWTCGQAIGSTTSQLLIPLTPPDGQLLTAVKVR